jgi:hypothetical protein
MKLKICLRLYVEKQDDVVPHSDQEECILFYPNDELQINMGDKQPVYSYKLVDGALVTTCQVPPYVDDLVECAIHTNHISFVTPKAGTLPTKRWIVIAHANRSQGLCRCEEGSLDPGDFVQLWSGELLCFTRQRRLELVPQAWIPGYDRVPSQKSRPWEEDFDNDEE